MAFGATKKVDESVSDRPLGDLFKPVTELMPDRALKIGIWGKAKVGKTHFCLTIPTGKIYVIDTEGSIKTNIQQFGPDVQARVFVAEVLQFADKEKRHINLVQSLDVLVDAIDKITSAIADESSGITIVIDSATDMWDWLGIWIDEKPGTQHIKGGDQVARLEWGKANKRYAEMMYMLLHGKCNVIMTFRAKEAVGNDGANLGYYVPRWQKNTDYWLDLIAQIDKVGNKRSMIFKGGRYGDTIPVLDNPSWPRLTDHLDKVCKVKFN